MVLHDTVASDDATHKLKVQLTNISKPRRRSSLSVISAPFRSFAGDRFSGSRVTPCSMRLLLGSFLKVPLFVALSLR